jgi:hypothetical protein
MENDLLRSLLYFFSGVFSYRLLSALLNYNHVYNSFHTVIKSCLDILILVDQSIEYTNNYRYDRLKETDLTEEEFEKIKQLDYKTVLTWRKMVIDSMLRLAPRHFKLSKKFNSWNQAINYRGSFNKQD